MKVVSPYRPFAPESPAHLRLGPFDWPGALGMLCASVQRACQCECYALTDLDTPLAVPAHRYPVTESRLMLWLLAVCRDYLRSDAFDDDTVLISPDALVFADLRPWFLADLGVVVRVSPKFAQKKPLLNGVQFWRLAARRQLVAFYDEALAIARTLPDSLITWGADTEPLRRLLQPLVAGPMERAGLTVYGIRRMDLFQSVDQLDIGRVARGETPRPPTAIVDFRYLRKLSMAAYFAATRGSLVSA